MTQSEFENHAWKKGCKVMYREELKTEGKFLDGDGCY